MATAQTNVPEFVLSIISGGESGQSFVFQQPEVTLGRVANNDLVLYDAEVSRRHLVIYYESQQWIVEDLESSNGTVLNGQRLYYPATLQYGDILEVGAVAFRFSTAHPSQSQEMFYQEVPAAQPATPSSPVQQQGNPFVQFKDASASTSQVEAQRNEPTRQHMIQEKLAKIDAQRQAQQQAQAAPTGQFQAPRSPGPVLPQSAPPPPPPAQGSLQLQDLMNAPQPFAQPQAAVVTLEEQPQAKRQPPKPIGVSKPSMPHPGPSRPPHSHAERQPYSYGVLPSAQVGGALTEATTQNLTYACFFLIALAVGLFVTPLPKSRVQVKQTNVVQLNDFNKAKVAKKVYGYNQFSRNRKTLREVHFEFQHRGGKVALLYRLNSPNKVSILINGLLYLRLPPTPARDWLFKRHWIPRGRLKLNQVNRITFQRSKASRRRFWGVTQLRVKDTPFPLPSQVQARRYCQKGYALIKQKERSSEKRFEALQAFRRCQDYLELLQRKPQLYYVSKMMVSQIDNELELLFLKHLQRAKKAKENLQSKQIYHTLLKYFPSKADPRHQRIRQLLRN